MHAAVRIGDVRTLTTTRISSVSSATYTSNCSSHWGLVSPDMTLVRRRRVPASSSTAYGSQEPYSAGPRPQHTKRFTTDETYAGNGVV
jgi:hypothetical protein